MSTGERPFSFKGENSDQPGFKPWCRGFRDSGMVEGFIGEKPLSLKGENSDQVH